MLSQNKRRVIEVFIFLITLFSCINSIDIKEQLYKQYSIECVGDSVYNKVYIDVNDTVKNWIRNNFEIAKAYKETNWKIDSLVCFNKIGNKCIMSIYRQYNEKVNNAIDFLYGVKISQEWYFFQGACIYIFSENYGYEKDTPLSFEKLHEIAMKEVFSGYLIKKKKDAGFWKNIFSPEYEYEVNEEFFSELDRIIRQTRESEEKYHGKTFKSTEEYMEWFAKSIVEANWNRK